MKSPCVQICKLIDSMCIGCYRTSDEITNWTKYTEEQRDGLLSEKFNHVVVKFYPTIRIKNFTFIH